MNPRLLRRHTIPAVWISNTILQGLIQYLCTFVKLLNYLATDMPKQQTKLVILTIPYLVGWGTELQTLALAKALREQGWRVAVCCYYDYDNSTLGAFRDARVELILLDMERNQGIIKLISRLRKLFEKLLPDVVHVQYMIRGLAAIIAARLASVPRVFATVHHPGRVYGWKQKALFRLATILATRFFCNSRSVEESWFGHSTIFDPSHPDSQSKHATIYNAVAMKELPPAEAERDSAQLRAQLGLGSHPVIGMIGRVSGEKGHKALISAFPIILQAVPEAVLLVIGTGPDLPEIKRIAEARGLLKSIIWMDRLPQEKLFNYYRIMDVVVVPSLLEGFGLVAAEASGAGRPVVASDIDGLREVIEDGATGLLVSPDNCEALANAVIKILKDKEFANRLGDNGRQRVKELFSYDRFSESIKAVYAGACS